jgi:hypothetical protein
MLQKHTAGFQKLSRLYTNFDHTIEIAKYASVFTVDFDQLIRCYHLPKEQQHLGTPNIALVKFTRWCVLHDILRLPAPDPDTLQEPEQIVAEMCRLILLAYALFAIVPMSPEHKIHTKLTDKFDRILRSAVELGIPAKHSDLFLCAVGWAFMCAHKAIGRRKLGKLLRMLVGFLEYQDLVRLDNSQWPTVEDVMNSFLWLDSYCEEPGRKYWACACGIAQKEFPGE